MTTVLTSFWFFAVAGGALLLGLGIAYAMWRGGQASPAEDAAGERGAERLYHKEKVEKSAPAAFSEEGTPDVPGEDAEKVRPAGPEAMEDPPEDWDEVDESEDESFPASDPPARY